MHVANCLEGELISEYDGGHTTVFRSEHKGLTVAIKSLRLYQTSDFDKCIKVSILTLRLAEIPANKRITEVHSRSCCMEASPTSEHPTVTGYECRSRRVPARDDIRMDGSR